MTTCQNCSHPDNSCKAAARAFRNGINEPPGTIWQVCRQCRARVNDDARTAHKANRDWTGQTT